MVSLIVWQKLSLKVWHSLLDVYLEVSLKLLLKHSKCLTYSTAQSLSQRIHESYELSLQQCESTPQSVLKSGLKSGLKYGLMSS